MFTSADKAIAAILGGILSFAALKFGFHADWLTPDLINTLSVTIAGALVYLVPNKPAV